MRNATRSGITRTLALLALGITFFAAPARAMDKPRVEDKAGFFSQDAVGKANEVIAQAKRDSGKDLYIETQPAIPDELKSQYRPEQRGQFFARWADERAKAVGVSGVIVLISRDPSYVQVRVGKNTIQQSFIQRDADHLQSILTSAFKSKEFDQGLLSGVQYFRDTVAQSTPKGGGTTAAPAPAPTNRGASQDPSAVPPPRNAPRTSSGGGMFGGMGSWICIGFAVLLVFMLFRAMRARSAIQNPQGPGQGYGAPGPYGGGYPQQGGYQAPGSGAGRGFLGGLLGGALGGYAYDRFMRRPGDSGSHGDPGTSGGGSGGSFDSPSDTSDFGGGGGGGGSGGDFGGGGDAGGGGGDGGGGSGGDF